MNFKMFFISFVNKNNNTPHENVNYMVITHTHNNSSKLRIFHLF